MTGSVRRFLYYGFKFIPTVAGYTESQIIPNTSKKACNRGISERNIRDNFLCVCTVSFPEIQALEK